MAQETVLVPDIGGSDAAEVVEVLVSPGDIVEIDQGLLVLESDKASMEIPSTVAGTVVEVLAKDGDQLAEGAAVAVIETTDAAAGEADSAAVVAQPIEPVPEEAESKNTADTPASATPVSQAVEITVPDIGTDEAVDLIEISVSVGDTVAEGDTLVVLETDKASMEVPSTASGVVKALQVNEGQQVKQGDVLLILDAVVTESNVVEPSSVDSKASAPAPTAAPAPAVEAPVPPASKEAAAAPDSKGKGVYAGPAVRRLAREFGVPLGSVKSSGPRGRILKEDLHQYVSRALAAPGEGSGGAGIPVIPDVDFSAFGPVDVVERSKIDKITATNMQRNWLNVPHVTQFDDADITEMEAFRKSLKAEAEKRGSRLTPLPFLLKACAVALKRNEKINSSLSDGGSTLTYKRYVHIGMAVDTPAGLVVPVIRDVDQKTLWELADEVIELAGKARDRKLKPADMQGGGFTVSSLGSIGGRGFTPIVNAPEVAILGVSRANTQPVWDGQSFQPRLQLPLALSYDHRVVNGGDAGRFLTELCQLLGDIRNLLL
ncbi:MAG: pyruvate dehydrogenase E2 component (dihydrolipoamide acetyltransferase) [Glaciecola sp.]|uniref:dihydrolipoyllysine-residue acetyltransferase n=1 Tax=Congregibacter sp. TaxID=2744308 RepID=UPI0039E3E015